MGASSGFGALNLEGKGARPYLFRGVSRRRKLLNCPQEGGGVMFQHLQVGNRCTVVENLVGLVVYAMVKERSG